MKQIPIKEGGTGHIILGQTSEMMRIFEMVKRIAKTKHPVLVTGPTGAGKEVIAQLIHRFSEKPDFEFVDINCAAIPEHLIESHFFGHEKGAFTGADKNHDGFFSTVGEGTLFLDEIADLSLLHQSKLLRVLETRQFRPVGSNKSLSFNGRIIAACHKDLKKMVENKIFREDLFYRLNVFHIEIPGLEEREEDIPELVSHFLARQHRRFSFSREAMKELCNSSWPGNIRQLKNTVDKIAVLSDEDPVSAETVRLYTSKKSINPQDRLTSFASEILKLDIKDKISAAETTLINLAMKKSAGNKSEAGRVLGVHRKVIERRLKGEYFNTEVDK